MDKKDNGELIKKFLSGQDPMEHIISMECGYDDEKISIIYRNADNQKRVRLEDFKPFVWAKRSVCLRMFDGDRKMLSKKLKEFGIKVKELKTSYNDSVIDERLEEGYRYMFYSTKRMSFQRFMLFFQMAKTPIYPRRKKNETVKTKDKEFLAVSPIEQYMMVSGRRMFKGYEGYDELKRMLFDLETQGLNPRIHAIDQIGIRTNKGFEKVISIEGEGEEKKKNELDAIEEMIQIIAEEQPDVIAGHNSEKFDWSFIITRCEVLGTSLEDISLKYFKHPIFKKKKEAVLKLGGEVEYYYPTMFWGFNILDSLHAVRRAQAIDSSMKSANLKYVTKYLELNKDNRVYVPGNHIGEIWMDKEYHYAFNNINGDWYNIEGKEIKENYELATGRYIVERYLLDDIWETDKVELALNEANFLVCKMLPTTFSRACTMGTAGIWKLIMLAWCYENNLGIPALGNSQRFTGGLSRLLKTGYVDRVVKLDYNSLYPSIMLTWNITNPLDISNAMLEMLNYVLTNREYYKDLKGEFGGKAKAIKKQLESFEGTEEEKRNLITQMQEYNGEKNKNDKKQLPLKILGNSIFGSYGAPHIFPFGNIQSSEKVTCIGRQCLRLMIHHFTKLGYMPIVGDTDGFNFQMPKDEDFRYTDENPYISTGEGRNSVKGKAYTKVEGDVAEFEDLYFTKPWNGGINKMGLGVDEYVPASINYSRKNYSDLLDNGKTKLVGNTVKSRKMSGYLENFLTTGIDLLLHGKGQEFLDVYYDYISRIYNYQIPLRDIASKGKIKKTIKEYIEDCKTTTKSGSKKSRQAWYELVIEKQKTEDFKVDIDDTIYYINTGTKKSESDVKRVTHQYVKFEGEIVEIDSKIRKKLLTPKCEELGIEYRSLKTKQIKEMLKPFIVREEDEIILNCKLVPREWVEADEDILCNDEIEYNVIKYIEQFNSRIKPLLVCFSPEIRSQIMITNPDDRQYFTKEQCELVSGFPNRETDQDTYEALMTPERKEIEYWLSINEEPPFIKECDIEWDKLVENYKEIKAKEDDIMFKEENAKYLDVLASLTEEEREAFDSESEIPSRVLDIVEIHSDLRFYFKKLPEMTPSTGGNIFEDLGVDELHEWINEENNFENALVNIE